MIVVQRVAGRKEKIKMLILGQILRWVVITELEPAFFSFADST